MKKEIQNIIETLRTDFKLSDEEIATKLQVSWATVYRWRKGKRKPKYATLKMLKQILNGYKAQEKR